MPAPPNAFLCPISLEIMRSPVSAADGHTYERASIERHMDQSSDSSPRSPITNLPLASRTIIPNHVLKSMIEEWIEAHPDDEWTSVDVSDGDAQRDERRRAQLERARVALERAHAEIEDEPDGVDTSALATALQHALDIGVDDESLIETARDELEQRAERATLEHAEEAAAARAVQAAAEERERQHAVERSRREAQQARAEQQQEELARRERAHADGAPALPALKPGDRCQIIRTSRAELNGQHVVVSSGGRLPDESRLTVAIAQGEATGRGAATTLGAGLLDFMAGRPAPGESLSVKRKNLALVPTVTAIGGRAGDFVDEVALRVVHATPASSHGADGVGRGAERVETTRFYGGQGGNATPPFPLQRDEVIVHVEQHGHGLYLGSALKFVTSQQRTHWLRGLQHSSAGPSPRVFKAAAPIGIVALDFAGSMLDTVVLSDGTRQAVCAPPIAPRQYQRAPARLSAPPPTSSGVTAAPSSAGGVGTLLAGVGLAAAAGLFASHWLDGQDERERRRG